jgi:hypothetical protein
VEGSGRTVLACPTPSRKHFTNQPGTRAGHSRRGHAGPTSLARLLAPGAVSACHGVHRPPVPRGQGRPPGQAPGDRHATVRAGLARARQPRGEKPPLPAPQEHPPPPGSPGRACASFLNRGCATRDGMQPLVVSAWPAQTPAMGRDIRCRLRLHRYRRKHNDAGEMYWECTRCGHLRQEVPDHLGGFGDPGGGGPGAAGGGFV